MSAASSAAAVAAVANAIKASGAVVRVKPEDFQKILARQEEPLIVRGAGGFFSTSYKYLTSYRGLAFFCKSGEELRLPPRAELINAEKMSMPEL